MKLQRQDTEPNTKKSSSWFLTILSVSILLFSLLVLRSPYISLRAPIKAAFIKLHDFIPYEGALEPNNLLSNAKWIAHKKVIGPECVAFGKDGLMYTGIKNGQIVRINLDTDTVETVIQIGGGDIKFCQDLKEPHEDCGSPLGIRFHPNNPDLLYVADAFYGLVKVDVKKATKKSVIAWNDQRFGEAIMRLCDDLEIDGDIVYFVDSSYEYNINEHLNDLLEALPRGRLFSYNEKTDQLECLAENLYFPNGLQLMPNKAEILINECTLNRILKVHLKGDEKGRKEIFAELPGLGDTIRMSDHETLLVPFPLPRMREKPIIFDLVGEYPLIRSLLCSILNVELVEKDFGSKYGLVVEYDLSGKALRSWHDVTGQTVKSITNAVLYKGKLYLPSLFEDYIAVIDY